MRCDAARVALSARLDGEDPGVPVVALDEHVAGCAACRAWEVEAEAVTRSVRIAPAPVVPDQTAAILVAAGAAARRSSGPLRQLRGGLAIVAFLQLGLALSGAVFGAEVADSLHVAHELAAWESALAVGFLISAWRPERAWGMLPLVAALVACLVATSAFDATAGNAGALGESTHALELAGLGLLWLVTRWQRFGGAARGSPSRTALGSV